MFYEGLNSKKSFKYLAPYGTIVSLGVVFPARVCVGQELMVWKFKIFSRIFPGGILQTKLLHISTLCFVMIMEK